MTEAQGPVSAALGKVSIRPMREEDLPEVDRVIRLAFGTFLGLPDPAAFLGDATLVHRWHANPEGALVAEVEGRLAGSNFAANWGSFAFLGPLTVHPELWDRGIAQQLLAATAVLFQRWGTRHAGLFTFPTSPKHLALYQKFGFWPRFLTPLMQRTVAARTDDAPWSGYRGLSRAEQEETLAACRELTAAVYPGLDVSREIESVALQELGETVLLRDGDRLDGFAVCHCGPGTEAGGGTCYVKFGVARPGEGAAGRFQRLLDACSALAAARGLTRIEAGVNTARREAYRLLLADGFRVSSTGVAMEWAGEAGYNRPDVYVLDDWR